MSASPRPTTGYALPSYPFRVPPEIERGTIGRYSIVIVGAGLAGLTAACDLADRGIATVVLDEDDTIGVRGASSRGIVYAQKTLEIFARLGLYARVREKGVLWSRGKTLAGDDIVYEFDSTAATPATRASLQPPYLNLQQFYIEWFLVDRIGEIGGADLRWKNRVVGIEDRGDYVRLEVETPAGRYALDAQWVIDASGLHSVVREALKVKKDDAERTPDRWCITDVRFEKPLPIERWTWVEAPFNENRAVWQHLMADDVWRMDFQMAPDSDPEAVSRPEVAADRIRRQIGADVAFELVWVGPYAYRSYVIDRFRQGRVFFIGDAAHVMSPFGARGGNSGIQDADNLGWKLALVVKGQASDALLESYHVERREAAVVNVEVTDRTARFLAPRTPVEHAIRRAAVGLARKHPFARTLVNTGRLSVANVYSGSNAIVYGAPMAGRSVPNVAVGVRVDGAARRDCGFAEFIRARGTRYVALWFTVGEPDASTLAALQALERREPTFAFAICGEDVPRSDSPAYTRLFEMTTLAQVFEAEPGSIVLVRPDLYVAGALAGPDIAALEALLARALGRSP